MLRVIGLRTCVRSCEKQINTIAARVKRFKDDESGALIIFGLLLLLMMLMAAGMAVDLMRTETTRTQVQNTLDRAILAAADLSQTADPKTVVIDYFEKAGLSNYLEEDTIDVVFSKPADKITFRSVSANAGADVDTFFMKMIGIDSLPAAAVGSAQEGITDVEISLVVDVSGSMGNGTTDADGNHTSKIALLREAAKDFSYFMQCNPGAERGSGAACTVEDGAVSISLVPYSEQVVAGELLLDKIDDPVLTPYTVTDEHTYSHCVTFDDDDFRSINLQHSEDPANPTDITVERTGHFDPWTTNRTDARDSSRTCRTGDSEKWREIKPFIKDHTKLATMIDALRSGGNTSIDLGMKWGVALLNPEMNELIRNLTITPNPDDADQPYVDPLFVDRPYRFTQQNATKVVVMMTDGKNTTQHQLKEPYRRGTSEIWLKNGDENVISVKNNETGRFYYLSDGQWHDEAEGVKIEIPTYRQECYSSWWYGRRCYQVQDGVEIQDGPGATPMAYPAVWKRFTTDWYEGFHWLEDPVDYNNNTAKNARLEDICNEAKKVRGVEGNNNIIMTYTIGFEVGTNSDEEIQLKKCATDGNYFKANGENLVETFKEIATSINKLRLTQ